MISEDSADWRRVLAELRALNTRRLRHVGIATYFGVYALIALGLRRGVNTALQSLPQSVRPAPLAPIDAVLGLPTSVAWSLTSLSITLAVVVGLAAVSVLRALSADESTPESTPDDPFTTPTVVPPGDEVDEADQSEQTDEAGETDSPNRTDRTTDDTTH